MGQQFNKYSLFCNVFEYWAANFNSYQIYIGAYKKKSLDIFWNKPINEIGINDINNFLTLLVDSGLSDDTCYHYYRLTRIFFDYLEDMNLIELNTTSQILFACKRKRYSSREINLLSLTEIKTILKNLENTILENIVNIILYTGQSLKNLLMLTWLNIDFDNYTITINGRKLEVDETVIIFFMKELKKQYETKSNNNMWRNTLNFVFTDKYGKNLNETEINSELIKLGKVLNINKLNSRVFVDHYIITALKNGVSPKTLVDQLGLKGIERIKKHIELANITDYGLEVGNEVCLTDTLYERYIGSNE